MAMVSAEVMKYPQYSNEVGSQCLLPERSILRKDSGYGLYFIRYYFEKKHKTTMNTTEHVEKGFQFCASSIQWVTKIMNRIIGRYIFIPIYGVVNKNTAEY